MARDPAAWYVIISEQETGPLTRVELGVELASGAISAETLVWKEGMINWLPGAQIAELEALFKNPPRSPRAAGARPPPPPRAQQKGMGLSDFDTRTSASPICRRSTTARIARWSSTPRTSGSPT